VVVDDIQDFKTPLELKILIGKRIQIKIIKEENHDRKDRRSKQIQHRRFIKLFTQH
jgi:hypothetical protein